MLDVYDWIVGNNYPRQEHLESLRAVDATANLGAESTVDATANLGAESTVGAVTLYLTNGIPDGPLDSHPGVGVPADRTTSPTFQTANPSTPGPYLKDCPKTSAMEMEADWQRETRLRDWRPSPLIRQPSLLCWTETHPVGGSVCITSHVQSHEEF